MFSRTQIKYSPKEREYLSLIETEARSLMPEGMGSKWAKRLLDKCIKEADKLGLRGYDKRGDELIKDELFVSKRARAGLTYNDILSFWNRDYVWLLAEEKVQKAVNYTAYKTLLRSLLRREPRMISDRAIRICRKRFIYYGDPERSNKDFFGEDADIYNEFLFRHNSWRAKYPDRKIAQFSQKYSTYNAMVRDLIRKGLL